VIAKEHKMPQESSEDLRTAKEQESKLEVAKEDVEIIFNSN
jgi:hypothetical protein